jgi:hypothetical protein
VANSFAFTPHTLVRCTGNLTWISYLFDVQLIGWCLLINVPIAGIALLGAGAAIAGQPARRVRLDLVGACSSAAGMIALVFALAEVANRGWTDPLVLTLLAAGVLMLVVFTVAQRRVAHPLLPLGVLLDRARGGAFLAIGLPQLALFGFFLVLTYWFQQLLGYTPGTPGLYLTRFLPAEILIGLGLGCAITPAVAAATSGVSNDDTGVASAAVNAVTQLGGSIGTGAAQHCRSHCDCGRAQRATWRERGKRRHRRRVRCRSIDCRHCFFWRRSPSLWSCPTSPGPGWQS